MAMQPSSFYPGLSDDRLRTIASRLLDVRFSTMQELNSPFDDNYTRESTVFGRSRNMLLHLGKQKIPWLDIKHSGMDVTIGIDSVPCRFFRDYVDNPEKRGFFKRNAVDCLFDIDETQPVMWRFVIERALNEDDEDRVFFIGYNVYHEKVAEWMYQNSTPTLHTVDNLTPAPALLMPAEIDIRDDEAAVKTSTSI
ncbi:hypothetical protein C7W93_14775 [Glaciimonas sp. PCH181]|nr:hypothetical protein C7W93_14775 [Glaciimonas sp. PCH181]